MNSILNSPNYSHSQLIAILGCTGTVGREVMRQLAAYDVAVRGILRQADRYPIPHQDIPARISYVTVNHESVGQLSRAFTGVDALFLLLGTHPEQVQSELRAIEAAQRAGVKRIVKLSVPLIVKPASVEVAHWHREIETVLKNTTLEHCCLRPYAFMQNWLRNTHTIRYFGRIIGSAGSAPRNYVDCRDVASIAAQLLIRKEPLNNHAISLTGPEAITNQDMAKRISLVTKSNVQYDNLTRKDHYHALIKRAKLPDWLAQHIVELEELALEVPEQPNDAIQTYLGRYPRTMDEFLQEHRTAFVQVRKPWIRWAAKS